MPRIFVGLWITFRVWNRRDVSTFYDDRSRAQRRSETITARAFPYSTLFHSHAGRIPLTFNGRLIRRRILRLVSNSQFECGGSGNIFWWYSNRTHRESSRIKHSSWYQMALALKKKHFDSVRYMKGNKRISEITRDLSAYLSRINSQRV